MQSATQDPPAAHIVCDSSKAEDLNRFGLRGLSMSKTSSSEMAAGVDLGIRGVSMSNRSSEIVEVDLGIRGASMSKRSSLEMAGVDLGIRGVSMSNKSSEMAGVSPAHGSSASSQHVKQTNVLALSLTEPYCAAKITRRSIEGTFHEVPGHGGSRLRNPRTLHVQHVVFRDGPFYKNQPSTATECMLCPMDDNERSVA